MLKSIKNILDKTLEVTVMVAVAVLVIDVLWQVFTRFVLGQSSSWTEELATFLLIWVALLGSAVALNRGAHLGIDYFVGKFQVRTRIKIEVVVFVLVAAFSILVMMLGGWQLVTRTLELGQKTSTFKNLKMGYVYLAVPISGFFLALYSVIGVIERVQELISGNVDESLHVSDSASEID
ncbi:2,3-diketo-L-gulonate TRAP transporter small permease protein YiaM [Anaerohalosphaera lusitana]|uniref:2,3-diketo-L-gulonate TRAP transporter small permease protein YiaM n=1 Tax=Anaerohalosphaera lusitana TaxID=1936003 RepID=A0A1U9NL11_9BACT|nr:TRAP transporter small permease [Anaerohalosphaera lusitana]AQT68621.1 2,3-diketo-L-gulonate TRAP transporter small permease protein YiaM [Anaerohalosphaera lusitana]